MRDTASTIALTALFAGCASMTASGPSAVATLAPDHHAGDMPMLTADGYGEANLTAELDVIAIGGGAADVIGRSVIVHKDPDDFKTQPTGNSGARVACGVIRKA